MIQIYTDDVLAYDSRLERYDLLELKITTGLNIGGTATITMPYGHPAYNSFVSYRTIVTIYRDGDLRFRGRALFPDDTYYQQRTVTCEGELCLFEDGIIRPYSYKATPAEIFRSIVENYNEQVEDFKRFRVGSITVAEGSSPETGELNGTVNTSTGYTLNVRRGPGFAYSVIGGLTSGTRVSILETTTTAGEEWGRISQGWVAMQYIILDAETDGKIQLENENASTALSALNALIAKCGGYIKFSDAEDGSRLINWYTTLGKKSSQTIRLGENLLDFSRTEANTTDLATGIVPYGAKDEVTKKRLTIETVNGGKDYIIDEDARAIRGTIMATQTWDDVTDANVLLKKAKAFLAGAKFIITSLELSALDLSYINKSFDSFSVGDLIGVVLDPYGLNEDFQLTQMTEDLLRPAQSKIILGKDIPSLTGFGGLRSEADAIRRLEKRLNEMEGNK